MKTITSIVLLLLCVLFSNAQEKGEFGIYTEGAWFLPKDLPGNSMKNGIATGVGVYYELPVAKKLFANLGVGYRFKKNQKFQYDIIDYDAYGYSPYGYNYGYSPGEWLKFPQHYIVVPFKLKYKLKNNFFVQSGLEANWLLNYDFIEEKPEFNWSIGFGSKLGDLEWSLSYKQGTKLQGMLEHKEVPNEPAQLIKNQNLRNRMLSLNLSYPLWKF